MSGVSGGSRAGERHAQKTAEREWGGGQPKKVGTFFFIFCTFLSFSLYFIFFFSARPSDSQILPRPNRHLVQPQQINGEGIHRQLRISAASLQSDAENAAIRRRKPVFVQIFPTCP